MEIYKITNLINGKIYIGKDTTSNKNYFGSGKLIVRSIKKYGIENFSKEILERCEDNIELCKKEKEWIKYYNSTDRTIGYNISNGGDGGDVITNNPNREEILQKISKVRKGKKYEDFLTEEQVKSYKEKLSKHLKGKTFDERFGVERSKEIRQKISNASKLRLVGKKKEVKKVVKKKNTEEEIQKRKMARIKNNLLQTNDMKTLKGYYFRYRKNNKLELLRELMGDEKYQKVVDSISKPYNHSEKTKQEMSELKKIKFIQEKDKICEILREHPELTIYDIIDKSRKQIHLIRKKFLKGVFSYLLTENEKDLIKKINIKKHEFTKNHRINMNEKLGKHIEIDGVNFISVSEASRILNIDRGTIRYRLRNEKFSNYIYL